MLTEPIAKYNQFMRAERADVQTEHRSGCPINLATEVLGDKWSLVLLRDVMFGNRRHFSELLHHSEEGIASNILAHRLQRLTINGLLTRTPDPSHKQKIIYSLTEPAIQLVPVLAHLGAWGRRHLPVTRQLAIRAELLEHGGPPLWDRFMDELREQHLGIPRPAGVPSAFAELQAAYQAEVAATNPKLPGANGGPPGSVR
jgi:DNA-binding HxlR family transcriptional regulator